MNAKKTALSTSIALALGVASHAAQADLTTSATLNFVPGGPGLVACNYGTTPPCKKAGYSISDIVGSYFAIDIKNDGFGTEDKTPISAFNGIHIGTIQSNSGVHSGLVNGSEAPNIDVPWNFWGNTGMHRTTSPITVLADNGFTKTLDFSGWGWDWNYNGSFPFTDLGTTITCDTVSCSDGSNYTLDGTFHVGEGIGTSGFTSVSYGLHLEGTISHVPVPAAAWLFGSGLAGLIGMARRKRA